MSLSIEDCASQLDLYAASKEQQAADQKAHAETLPEGLYRSLALMMADPYAASAFSLRFAATFLRQHCVLRWTSEQPTKPGHYHYRWSYNGIPQPPLILHVIHHEGVLKAGDEEGYEPVGQGWPESAEWAGPIPIPAPIS